MSDASEIARNLVFDNVKEPGVISYSLKNHANSDPAAEIKVIFNGNTKPVTVKVPKGKWTIVAEDGRIDPAGLGESRGGTLTVPATSALILTR